MKPQQFLERLSQHLKHAIARSLSIANNLHHLEVSPIHLLFGLVEERGGVASEILSRVTLDGAVVLAALSTIKTVAGRGDTTIVATVPELNKTAKLALERAMLIAYERGHQYVGTEHLLLALLNGQDKTIELLLTSTNIDVPKLMDELDVVMESTSRFPDITDVKEAMNQLQDMISDSAAPQQRPPAHKHQHEKPVSILDVFTTNLTSQRSQKTIDPVIGREREIERLIHILCRRTKNNPVLVGEPGVGKTAIVEGLAKRISEGNVPDILKRKKILSLDLTLLIAGTIYRGEFEARLKQIIDELRDRPDYILFIDEIHNIIGAGGNQGTMDAANILKPALARGQLRCIGATTIDEYKKHIGGDPALERRFQSVSVEEPTAAETIAILQGIKKYYETFHHATITDQAIERAVELSMRYIHDNFLPDKAVDLIDEASAAVRTRQKDNPDESARQKLVQQLEDYQEKKDEAIHTEQLEAALTWKAKEKKATQALQALDRRLAKRPRQAPKKVTAQDIADVVASKLQLPIDYLLKNEWEQLQTLPHDLQQHIIGQDPVIEQITKTLRLATLGIARANRPLASFLFAGPSGVGKTAMAKALAETLYHDPKALIKFDMSEFAESHSVSKILGSPAGYIGYKERNRFTDELRKRPYAVILFDEFDKAHTDVQRLLFQILDEGELTDSHGKKIHFRHHCIILTTNIGTEFFASSGIGFDKKSTVTHDQSVTQEVQKKLQSSLKEHFGAALLGRINTIALFAPLTAASIEKIIEKMVAEISTTLAIEQHFSIGIDSAALQRLAASSLSIDTGARHVHSQIEQVLHDIIMDIMDATKRKKHYTLTTHAEHYRFV